MVTSRIILGQRSSRMVSNSYDHCTAVTSLIPSMPAASAMRDTQLFGSRAKCSKMLTVTRVSCPCFWSSWSNGPQRRVRSRKILASLRYATDVVACGMTAMVWYQWVGGGILRVPLCDVASIVVNEPICACFYPVL